MFGIATVAGPFLGAAIIDHVSWRWVFYVNIPIGLAGLAILLAALGPILPEKKGRFDAVGAVLLSAWVAALMFPLIQVSEGGWTWGNPRVAGLLVAAAVLVVVFVGWEIRMTEPLVPLRLLRQRIVAACGGTTFIVGAVVFPLATLLTLFISGVTLSGSANPADRVRDVLYFLVIPLVLGAALGGTLLTRVNYRPVVLVGVGVAALGMFLLTSVNASTPLWTFAFGFLPVGGVVAPLIPIGFGTGLTFPVFLLAVQNQVPEADVGAATGLVQFLQSLGGALGLTLLSSYSNLRTAALQPPVPSGGCPPGAIPPSPVCVQYSAALLDSIATVFEEIFLVLVALLLIGFLLSLFISGHLPRGKSPTAVPAGA